MRPRRLCGGGASRIMWVVTNGRTRAFVRTHAGSCPGPAADDFSSPKNRSIAARPVVDATANGPGGGTEGSSSGRPSGAALSRRPRRCLRRPKSPLPLRGDRPQVAPDLALGVQGVGVEVAVADQASRGVGPADRPFGRLPFVDVHRRRPPVRDAAVAPQERVRPGRPWPSPRRRGRRSRRRRPRTARCGSACRRSGSPDLPRARGRPPGPASPVAGGRICCASGGSSRRGRAAAGREGRPASSAGRRRGRSAAGGRRRRNRPPGCGGRRKRTGRPGRGAVRRILWRSRSSATIAFRSRCLAAVSRRGGGAEVGASATVRPNSFPRKPLDRIAQLPIAPRARHRRRSDPSNGGGRSTHRPPRTGPAQTAGRAAEIAFSNNRPAFPVPGRGAVVSVRPLATMGANRVPPPPFGPSPCPPIRPRLVPRRPRRRSGRGRGSLENLSQRPYSPCSACSPCSRAGVVRAGDAEGPSACASGWQVARGRASGGHRGSLGSRLGLPGGAQAARSAAAASAARRPVAIAPFRLGSLRQSPQT